VLRLGWNNFLRIRFIRLVLSRDALHAATRQQSGIEVQDYVQMALDALQRGDTERFIQTVLKYPDLAQDYAEVALKLGKMEEVAFPIIERAKLGQLPDENLKLFAKFFLGNTYQKLIEQTLMELQQSMARSIQQGQYWEFYNQLGQFIEAQFSLIKDRLVLAFWDPTQLGELVALASKYFTHSSFHSSCIQPSKAPVEILEVEIKRLFRIIIS